MAIDAAWPGIPFVSLHDAGTGRGVCVSGLWMMSVTKSLTCLELCCQAFEASALIEWPDDPAGQRRYQDIEDEILERTYEAM
jgi:hypothetical protein